MTTDYLTRKTAGELRTSGWLGGYRVTNAKELYERLKCKRPHTCKRGRAPDGYLEVWPDDVPAIWLICWPEYNLLDQMCEKHRRPLSTTP
ncbi:MAG: hypothetical protein EBR82_29005 [Caulobacteraceae bacterium]|nr:hypothetical protein [Caulobacteraceae bacterium]